MTNGAEPLSGSVFRNLLGNDGFLQFVKHSLRFQVNPTVSA
jgi:hypothetical protein